MTAQTAYRARPDGRLPMHSIGSSLPSLRRRSVFWLLQSSLFSLLLYSGLISASSTGITGRSTIGCVGSGCHTNNGGYDYNGLVQWNTGSGYSSANPTIDSNESLSIRFLLDYLSPDAAPAGGFNMSASGGTLSDSSGTIQNIGGELTHTTPRLDVSNDIIFDLISWDTATTESGIFSINACGQPVNNTGTTDGDGSWVCDTLSVTVRPVVNLWTGTVNYTENAAAIVVDSSVVLYGSADFNRAETNITNDQTGDQLFCPNPAVSGVSCSGNGTTSLVLFGTTARANYETAIEDITFSNSSDAPSTTTRTIQIRVRGDNNVYSSYVSKSITVTAVNDAPVLSGVNSTPVYTEGTPAVVIDNSITITDPDSAQLNQATVSITGNFQSLEDELVYSTVNGITGSYDSNTGVLLLTGLATLASYEGALETVQYRNNSANPNTSAARTITFQVRDSSNALSNTDPTTVTVQAVSTPPTISGVDNTPTYVEDSNPGVIIDNSITVTDPDSVNCNEASIVLSTNYRMGEDRLDYTGGVAGITAGTFNAANGTLILSGPASCSDFATALENVRFRNTSNSPDTSLRRVEFQVLDSGNVAGNVDTTSINIMATNDAPLAVDDTFAVAANSSGNELNVLANDSDPDVIDTLTIASVGTPDSGGTVGIGAPCAANTLCYAPPPDSTGVETFTYTVQDAAGATDTATVSVSPSDSDGDGTADLVDNCPDLSNSGQEDEDGDKIGDVCDVDADGDGVLDGYIRFSVDQGGMAGSRILQSDGAVTITASLTIAAGTGGLTFNWDGSAAELLNIATVNDATFSFDPATLSAGHFLIDLRVSEGQLSTHNSMLLTVVDTVPATDEEFDCDNDGVADNNPDCDGDGVLNLADGVRDLDGDGVPDYLDEFDDPVNDTHWLPNQTVDLSGTAHLITETGLSIGLGPVAIRAGRHGSLISIEDIENHAGSNASQNARDSLINLGGVYDFQITGLGRAGDSARIVIPLTSGILNGAEYRKYTLANGWRPFVTDANNRVASAAQTLGMCPDPGSAEYVDGLRNFNRCVQLTLEDGGPNDADGEVNGVIRDPGGVAVFELIPEREPAATPDDGSGGGVWHPCLLLLLLLRGIRLNQFALARWKYRFNRSFH